MSTYPNHVARSDWGRGSWMQTFTGRRFFPLDAKPEDIDPRDIAHALSMICRYGGHTQRFYSVAEHCYHVSYAVPAHHALRGLLHDAAEAYVGDMVRPLKHHMPQYREVEDRLLSVIAERFEIRGGTIMVDAIKEADNRILLDERAALLTEPPAAWVVDDLEPLGLPIYGWEPRMAEAAYLQRLLDLGIEVPA